jgi:hypothetical protein
MATEQTLRLRHAGLPFHVDVRPAGEGLHPQRSRHEIGCSLPAGRLPGRLTQGLDYERNGDPSDDHGQDEAPRHGRSPNVEAPVGSTAVSPGVVYPEVASSRTNDAIPCSLK